MPGEFSFMSGGNSELTAEMLNKVMDFIRRQGRLWAVPPLRVVQHPEGWHVLLEEDGNFWARLEGSLGSGRYAWREVKLDTSGDFVDDVGGRYGGEEGYSAREANELVVLPGTIVRMEPTVGADRLPDFVFSAPIYDPGLRRKVFWARLTGEIAGSYSYTEVTVNQRTFREVEEGRRASLGQEDMAVEANGTTGIPAGTIVLLYDSRGLPDDESDPTGRIGFRYGAASGMWGKITGKTRNTVHRVSLREPDSGTWSLSILDDPDGDAVPYDSGTLSFAATAADVQAALAAVLGSGQSLVSEDFDGSGESTFLIEFIDFWGGDRSFTLSLQATSLGYDAVPAAFAKVALVTQGFREPHTDGKGAYNWLECVFSAEGKLQPKEGGKSSSWPLGAAYEASGETRVPPGTFIRLNGGAVVPTRNSDGSVTDDQRYSFSWTPADAWAVLGTGAAWRLDLNRPTGGWFSVFLEDDTPRADAMPRLNQKQSLQTLGATVVPSFTLTWLSMGISLSVPGDCSATELQSLLEAASPLLLGNVACSGGSLGDYTPPVVACSPDGLDGYTPPAVVAADTNPVVIEFVEMLSGVELPLFQVSGAFVFSSNDALAGTPGSDANNVRGSGDKTMVLPFDCSLSALAAALSSMGRYTFAALSCLAAASTLPDAGIDQGEVTLAIAGYENSDSLPQPSLLSWLTYGEDDVPGTTAVSVASLFHAPDTSSPDDTSFAAADGSYACVLLDPQTVTEALPPPQLLLWEGRFVAARATESSGHAVAAGRTVRLQGTQPWQTDAEGLLLTQRWIFQAPPVGFWATVREGGRIGADYLLTSSAARLPVFAASERNGAAWVPVNAVVRVFPAGAGEETDYRFVYDPGEEVRLLVYRGAGFSAAEPSADAQLLPSLSPCKISTAGAGSVYAGGTFVGNLIDYAAGVTNVVPVYRVAPIYEEAAAGVPGLLSLTNQVLGAGSKSNLGRLDFRAGTLPADPLPSGGESMPATSHLLCESATDNTSLFFGVQSADATRFFGIEATGTPSAQILTDSGSAGTLARAIDASETYIPVEHAALNAFTAYTPGMNVVVQIGSEILDILEVCFSQIHAGSPPYLQQVWRVTRGAYGSSAATHTSGSAIARKAIWPFRGSDAMLATECWFRVSAPAFAIGSTVGGSGVVDLTYPTQSGQTLTFSGGLLTEVEYAAGPQQGFTGSLWNRLIACEDGEKFTVSAGLVQQQVRGRTCP